MRINAAKAAASAMGYTLKFKNLIWWQGEADANDPSNYLTYKNNTCQLFDSIRAATGEPNLNIIIVRIADYTGYAHRTEVRAAQKQIADSLAYTEWVDTDFYNPGVVHKSAVNYCYIGQDITLKAIK